MRLPTRKFNETYATNYNIYEVYSNFLKNQKSNLSSKTEELEIIRNDKKFNGFNDWLQKIVWYGHRSGDYISQTKKFDNQNKLSLKNENLTITKN